jgi:hypothetical protein
MGEAPSAHADIRRRGRGKPRFDVRQSSPASPTSILPHVGEEVKLDHGFVIDRWAGFGGMAAFNPRKRQFSRGLSLE